MGFLFFTKIPAALFQPLGVRECFYGVQLSIWCLFIIAIIPEYFRAFTNKSFFWHCYKGIYLLKTVEISYFSQSNQLLLSQNFQQVYNWNCLESF